MGRRSIGIGMIAAVLAVMHAGLGSAAVPTTIPIGWQLPIINGGFSPKALPKHEPAPVAMGLSGKVETLSGSRPPPLKEIDLDVDRNVSVNAKGLPVCRFSVEEPPSRGCHPAIVGKGTMEVEVEFPEQKPIDVKSTLLAFNGGVKEGLPTIYLYACFGPPINSAIVITAKVSKERRGRFGAKWVFTIPKIAGGYGSTKAFSLTIHREFAYKGKRRSYLLAKCPDGHLNLRATSVLSDGSAQADQIVRACTATG
jgi:hypothetical protein